MKGLVKVYIIYCASRDILIRQARQVPSGGVPVACVISSALSPIVEPLAPQGA